MVDFIVYIRVIRVIRSSYHPLFSFVIMSFCLKKNICLHLSLCHSVFKKIICLHLSLCYSVSKKVICLHLSLCHSVFKKIICLHLSLCHSVSKKVICLHLSLCHSVFKKIICLHLSLCHSVSKKSSVSIRPSVILSQKIPLSLFVLMLLCLPFILSVSY